MENTKIEKLIEITDVVRKNYEEYKIEILKKTNEEIFKKAHEIIFFTDISEYFESIALNIKDYNEDDIPKTEQQIIFTFYSYVKKMKELNIISFIYDYYINSEGLSFHTYEEIENLIDAMYWSCKQGEFF